jgi:carbamoyltransferase
LILGLNKYTHSTAAALFDEQGALRVALQKERLTRKKHAGGDVADLVRHLLQSTGVPLADVHLVVQNNHLFRIDEYERGLPFQVALHAAPPSALDPHNLFPHAERWELSHHLAHAWSVLPSAPFDAGLILVMDGMGSPRELAMDPAGKRFANDAALEREPGFVQVPETLDPAQRWREAETVYSFRDGRLRLLFKRWTPVRSPEFLFNYGFDDMESVGAVYSRVSSQLFGDWNQCGKVMGLAAYGDATRCAPFLKGPLERLRVDWDVLGALPHPNEWAVARRRKLYESFAARVQSDLERVVLDFVRRLRRSSGAKNLCFTGGVALNSLLNGRIVREAGFERVFLPPYPGDEGVAIGCGHFGVHELRRLKASRVLPAPYLGREIPADELEEALSDCAPWIEVERPADLVERTAAALARHEFVAWFQGRSEFGPRALGNRSILAHPGRRSTWKHLNARVKKREAFRPFAPTVLAEHAETYFEAVSASPYMSLTVPTRARAAAQLAAAVHVDGSARIQTLTREMNPLYYELLSAFERKTGLPVLLNTSFNIDSEPIVESPEDALRAFLDSELDLLVLGPYLVRKCAFPSTRRLSKLVPLHATDAVLETQSAVSGEPLSVSILLRGRTYEEDELGGIVLECSDGTATCSELIARLRRETGASALEIRARLERLWKRRLIRWIAAP